MKRTPFSLILLGLIAIFVCPVVTGCGHSDSEGQKTKQDVAAFNGGPMPESARKAMEADMARRAQKNGAPPVAATPPPAKP